MPQQFHIRFFSFVVIVTMLFLAPVACKPTSRPGDIDPVNPPPAAMTSPEPTAPPQPSPPQAAEATSEPPAEEQPGSPATIITLNIAGGIAGFCDTLVVSEVGQYVLQSCNSEEIPGALAPPDLDVLQAWYHDLAAFQITSEDNPGGPDNMTTEFVFNGLGNLAADEAQQQMIFDWANGLLIRTRPQAIPPPPTPTPPEISAAGLCPDLNRPAVVIANHENRNSLILMDPANQARCDLVLDPGPFGRIVTAAGHIYYPTFDPDTETMAIWQLSPDGAQAPLTFTSVDMPQFAPFGFVVSRDGAKIAWARTVINFEVEPPVYRNDLWVANIDGSEQVTLVNQVENTEKHYLELVRFAPDNSEIYYAMQPDALEQGVEISGRYDSVYSISVVGGQPQLIFACPSAETPICIGDLAPDANTLVYTQLETKELKVMGRDGSLISTLTPPATDYLGPAIFGPTGTLTFVSATHAQATSDGFPLPSPGYISIIEPPYTGQPQILLTDNSVATLWEWVDENRLAYGSIDEFGIVGTAIVTREGQMIELSPNFALAVLR